ncbi:DUF1450 domain-containing protein [Aquibacillus salsiterrae]|uniref:DUF1450 domain-containing protein n=1 Tax=Aquibacillus salsiterrae TaxID=2950439 RepID=A0A9X3WI23_9BACI|nr:DUF1450 domain-containing protein [Aquibacillus salsiterrae]MDC3417839.1 DUF1450 domain-containing protein [Aquibacillus salsiterrae]
MNPIVIEFCVSNLANGSQKARAELAKDPDLEIVEYGCTSFCGICSRYFVAIINGDPIVADNADELVEKVYDYLEENALI